MGPLRRRSRLGFTIACFALVAGLALFAASCSDDTGGGGSAEGDIEQTLRDIATAWNNQDWDAWSAHFTENGIMAGRADVEDQSPEGLRAGFDASSLWWIMLPNDELVIRKIGDITVDGDTATAEVEASSREREGDAPASIIFGVRATLLLDDGVWKIDEEKFTSPDLPDGVTTVHLDAKEFAFEFDPSLITSGNIAFEMANTGAQQHQIVIEQVPKDFDVEAALMSEDELEGTKHIGSTPPLEPGETRDIVFTNKLPAGRYVMLCFMQDTDGTQHALKGMWSEFTIE